MHFVNKCNNYYQAIFTTNMWQFMFFSVWSTFFTSTNSFKLLLFSSKDDDQTTFYFSKICGRPSQRVDNSSFRQPNHPIQERKKVNLTSQLSERAIVYTRNILCWCGYFVGVGGERKRKCLCCKYPMIRKRIFSIHCGSCH